MTYSLTRRDDLDVLRSGNPSGPWAKAQREAAIEFLNSRARWPGLAAAQRISALEAEVDSMSMVERTFLEIEMRQRSRSLHSYDYDPLAPGRL